MHVKSSQKYQHYGTNGRASAMPPKGQSRVFSKLGHKEGKELVVEST